MMQTKWMGGLVAIAVFLAGVSLASANVIREEIEFEGRPVVILLPKHYDKGSDLIPLVLHLHGAVPFPDVPDLELDNSGYRALPSKHRVMVVAPRGTLHPDLGLYFWNATEGCCGFEPVFGPQVDDVGYLNRLLNQLLTNYPIDPQRVYIYGYSNGAFMAYRMACDYAEQFAGIVAGAGATFYDAARCAPSVPVSVLHFHSVVDEDVLFNGGNFYPDFPTDYPGAIETVERWAALNGCVGELQYGNKPKYDLTTPGFADPPGIAGGVAGKDTTVHKFKQCPNGYDVELWQMSEGIPHPPLFFRVGANGIKELAEKSWAFLKRHKR